MYMFVESSHLRFTVLCDIIERLQLALLGPCHVHKVLLELGGFVRDKKGNPDRLEYYALRGNRTPGGSMATTQVTTTPLMLSLRLAELHC